MIPAVWGQAHQVAWAVGERTMVCAPQGAGKTTLAQRLALARCGLASEVLGMPVHDDGRKVLYIAGDRPAQALRSFRRMITDDQRRVLDERLFVWKGAPPIKVEGDRDSLLTWIHGLDPTIGTVVIDSLKDMAIALSKDEIGSAVDHALRRVSDAGIEVLALHHMRKGQQEKGAGKPRGLDDVYGSTWLTGGSGCVLLLWGQPGDLVVELSTLKPISDPIGPLTVLFDHEHGTLRAEDATQLIDLLRAAGNNGMTAADTATAIDYGTTRAARERARRELNRLVDLGLADLEPGTGKIPAKWFARLGVSTREQAESTSRDSSRTSQFGSAPSHAEPHAPHAPSNDTGSLSSPSPAPPLKGEATVSKTSHERAHAADTSRPTTSPTARRFRIRSATGSA